MKKEFVIRGKLDSGTTEVLNFSGHKKGYAYKLVEFKLYPSVGLGTTSIESCGSITAGKTAVDPQNPDFSNDGLIAVATHNRSTSPQDGPFMDSIINDTFMITQDLLLTIINSGSGATAVNWHCKFEAVKMSQAEEAVTNYKQFTISDE